MPGFATNIQRFEEYTVPISFTGSTYAQDFNSLSNNVSDGSGSLLPDGWTFFEAGGNTSYRSGTGSANNGDTYSFGAAGSTERAFGSLRSGSVVPTLGVSFTNDSGATITSLTIGYTGEQWRLGATSRPSADRLEFQYSVNATSLTTGAWIDGDALDFAAPITSGTTGALNGNAAANSAALGSTLTDLSIAPGQTFWLRWTDTDATGADDGLGIDDFTLSAGTVAPANRVNLSLSSAVALESAGTSITVTATTTAPVTTDQTVTLNVSGSGVTDADYALSATTITIPAGASSASVIFTVQDDGVAENHETALLSLSAPSEELTLGSTPSQALLLVDSTISSRIADVQGAGHLSPLLSSATDTAPVRNVPGIVTAVASNGFYLQDPTPDANAATSDAIFVFTNSAPTQHVGDAVLVSGTVTEFRAGGATSSNLTVTEITHNAAVQPLLVVAWDGAPAGRITPITLGTDRVPPTQKINDDFGAGGGNVETGGDFDPATEGIDFWESLEGMLVTVPNAVAVSPTAHFGSNEEIWVLADGGAGATGRTERGGIAVSPGDFNPERIQIDDLDSATTLPDVDVGARFGDMTGVVNYAFGNFEVLVAGTPVVTTASTLQRDSTTLAGSAGALTVATFNVENLDPGDGSFAAIAAAIRTNLGAPDILCVEEMQDNNGPTNNGVVDASLTFNTLIEAIVAAGGPRYEYRQIDPVDGQDGGEPGGNIRTGFLFNPDRVDFVEGSLQRLTDPVGGAFDSSRKPLVGEFVFNGEPITVIGNHFNSKGGDQPLFGVTQPPVLSSEEQRMKQATIVADYVNGLFDADAGASIIVLGDLNDFEFSNPVGVLEAAGLTSMVETLPVNQRYSYNFEGNAQVLDHIMVSPGLLAANGGFDVVHINSEFSAQLSDHDPSVARFLLAEQQVLVGTVGVNTLVGGAGHDTLTGLQGRDLLTGGGGDDRFVYTSILDAGDRITDFQPGHDVLAVGQLLASLGYTGTDPIADGLLKLIAQGGRTYAAYDLDGNGPVAPPRLLVELAGVTLGLLDGYTVFDITQPAGG